MVTYIMKLDLVIDHDARNIHGYVRHWHGTYGKHAQCATGMCKARNMDGSYILIDSHWLSRQTHDVCRSWSHLGTYPYFRCKVHVMIIVIKNTTRPMLVSVSVNIT